jgi:hypothetical protein
MTEPNQPTTPWRVILTSATFLGLAGVAALFFQQRTRPIDAAELVARWYVPAAWPFGMLPREAAMLADGSEVVRFAPETPIDEPARRAGSRDELPVGEPPSGGEKPYVDWTKLVAKPAGDPPLEVLIARHPRESGEQLLERQFRVRAERDLSMLPPEGGRRVLDVGTLPWSEFDARWVLEREFEPGFTFVDRIHVNLSHGEQVCILHARFARGTTASSERVEEFLAVLREVAPSTN